MQIGDVIRRYRKDKNMTQEEMGKRLGVTAPAVNKWENGNSLPDITLLSPIARLLDISLDTLLSHEKEISDTEAARLLEEVSIKLKGKDFSETFEIIKKYTIEYPNSHFLLLHMARIFNAHLQIGEVTDRKQYDVLILDCFKQVFKNGSDKMRVLAAESLFHFYVNKQRYAEAEEYIEYFSDQNPEKKRLKALIYSKTNRRAEAYKMYEEMLFSGFGNIDVIFNSMYILAMEDKNFTKARVFVEKQQELAKVSEFGEYSEASPMLELAILEKDEDKVIKIAEVLIQKTETLTDFTKSPLYEHMEFKKPDENMFDSVRKELLEGFRSDESYSFIKGNQRWRKLIGI